MPVLYLTEADVRQVLTMDVALPAVEAAFRKLALDEAVNCPRQRCQTDAVMLHVLPAAAKTLGAVGLKAYTTGKFEATFHVFLFDPKQGGLTAIIQADYLGQVRTGAASGVATKKLARVDAKTVGLFGTGKQARTQLEAICRVRTIESVAVYSRDEARRAAFAAEMTATLGVPVEAVASPELAAVGKDIVITATPGKEPVLRGEWVSPGTHLNLIGSNLRSRVETDVDVFRKATLVAIDSKEQGRMEAGDLVAPVDQGVIQWADVRELAPLLVGRYPGRESATDVTVFKSLGLGVEDIAVGVKVVELAKAAGLGVELPIN